LHQINLAQPHQHTQHQVIADMERDALHREVKRSQGSLESRYDYDPMGRLTRHKAGQAKANPIVTSMSYSTTRDASVEIERSYRYDAAGNLTNQIDALRGKQNYQYDPTGRILAATGRLNEAFAFDPAGNIQTTQSGRAAAKVKGNRLSVYQDLRFEYDLHGNVINRKKGAHEEAQFTWNGDHQLQNATVTRHGVTQTTSYEYDALGRRTKKTDAFGATEYLWDGDLMIHSQRGNKASLFVFEPNSFVPLATIQDDNIYWYQCDQIGAPQELTDEEGKIIWAADYKVWGEARLRDVSLKTGTDNWSSSSNYNWQTSTKPTPVIDQPFRFQGQQFDEETGLHYNRFRYYDPGVGRFAGQDPIGLAGGTNLFAYAPNPIGWVDPFGLAPKPPSIFALKDGAGASPSDITASKIGGGTRVGQQACRDKLLKDAKNNNGGIYKCWRCGHTSKNASDMHLGHKNVPTSKGGNLADVNVDTEGASCNLSAGNSGYVKEGMSCLERGSCGAPYGR
ncbi:RHS repeat-associated core domain-containing protein, partial [Undibacterium sp. GrIS 1.2]|uniref:RHS repeat domain-containing protein n=1 Tax=Undibacterium sp. GrIS 1.2 TaxID=3143933 RepID=UPI0033922E39